MSCFKYFFLIILIFLGINIYSMELDTNGDGRINRWITPQLYSEWKTLDLNKNGKADESWFFVSDKNIIYYIRSEEFDSNNDGIKDLFIKNTLEGRSVRTEIGVDRNTDGKPDYYIYKFNDIIYMEKYDNNYDGIFENMEEINDNGKNIKESVDTNNDGKMNEFYYYTFIDPANGGPGNKWDNNTSEGKIPLRYELDTNHDGKIDMWVVFNYDSKWALVKTDKPTIVKDNNFDGKPDEWHYTDEKRRVIRIEKDTNFDGKVNKIERF